MKKSIIKNVLYKVLLNIFNIIIPIIIGPYAYRIMGPTVIGTIDHGEAIYGYFFVLASFGIYNYGLREISRVRDDKKKLSELFSSLWVISIISNISVLIIFTIVIFLKFNTQSVFLVLRFYPLYIVANIFYVEWINEALENYKFITIKTIIVRLIYIVLLFTLVRTSKDYVQYILIGILGIFLNNVISFCYIKKSIKFSFKNIKIKRHIKPLIMVLIFANASVLYTQLDKLMLGQYINSTIVAFYGTGQKIMMIIKILIMSMIYATIPRLSNYLGDNNIKGYKSLLDTITQDFFMILFPTSIGLICLSREVVYLYGGIKFIDATTPLMIFSIYMVFVGIEAILSDQILYINGKEKILTLFIFLGGILNLIFNCMLVNYGKLDPSTAIATTLLAEIVLITVEYIYIIKGMKFQYNLLTINKLKYLIISLIFIPITILIKHFIPSIIVRTMLVIFANTTLYLGILMFIKDEELYKYLIKIKRKLNIF